MKKSIRIAIPTILILLFIFIMTTGSILKQPLSSDEVDVQQLIKAVEKEIISENWEHANEQLELTKQTWSKVVKRIQFSTERDEIFELQKSLERTEGYIKAKDKGGAMAELAEARHILNDIGT